MKHTLNTLCLDYEEESSPPSHDAITLLLDFEQLILLLDFEQLILLLDFEQLILLLDFEYVLSLCLAGF